MISVCVDAITDPILGWIVDHPKVNPKKFMLVGGLLTGILLTCTFVVVDGSQGFKFAYYVIVSSLMWVFLYFVLHSGTIPGRAQMTDDYDEADQDSWSIFHWSTVSLFMADVYSLYSL